MYNVRGVVTSQNYPTPYTEASDCQWNLQVPDGQLIAISFRSTYQCNVLKIQIKLQNQNIIYNQFYY